MTTGEMLRLLVAEMRDMRRDVGEVVARQASDSRVLREAAADIALIRSEVLSLGARMVELEGRVHRLRCRRTGEHLAVTGGNGA